MAKKPHRRNDVDAEQAEKQKGQPDGVSKSEGEKETSSQASQETEGTILRPSSKTPPANNLNVACR